MASFFQGANQIDARRSHFTQTNIQLIHPGYLTEEHEILASLNPVKSPYVQPCMPGTRQWMIDQIEHWLNDHQAPNILFLSGSPERLWSQIYKMQDDSAQASSLNEMTQFWVTLQVAGVQLHSILLDVILSSRRRWWRMLKGEK